MFKSILVCSDGSEPSLSAAEVAADMAKTYRAQLTLLHVCQIPSIDPSFPGAPTLSGPAVETFIQDMHTAVIRRTLPLIKQNGVCCEILEETGNPADVIARVANQQDFDLIIMGSRGVSKEKAEKLGSVSHRVIHDASCPVLIVR